MGRQQASVGRHLTAHLPSAALAAQAGGEDRALLVLLADERRTLERVQETVRQLQGVAAAAAGPVEQGGPHV